MFGVPAGICVIVTVTPVYPENSMDAFARALIKFTFHAAGKFRFHTIHPGKNPRRLNTTAPESTVSYAIRQIAKSMF